MEGYCLEVHPYLPLYRRWFPLSPVSMGYWKWNSQAKLKHSLGTVALVDDLVLLSAKWPLYITHGQTGLVIGFHQDFLPYSHLVRKNL